MLFDKSWKFDYQEKNKDELIDILVMNSSEQRQALSLQYKSEYRKVFFRGIFTEIHRYKWNRLFKLRRK